MPKKKKQILLKHGNSTLEQHLNNKPARTLNSVYDQEAAIHHNDTICPDITLSPENVHAEFYNIKMTSKNLNILHTLHHKDPYMDYLTKKFKWKPTTQELIDWENLNKYISTLATPTKVQYVKFSHKWRPRFEGSNTPICPFCGKTGEDNNYPFQCSYSLMS